MPAEVQRAGLIILGGFLGAGKSTWLRHQLRAGMLRGAEVFVNEAAGTPVDDLLLGDAARVTVLAGGCACCDGRPALVAALRKWCDRRNGAARVVLETSGLADPARIVEAVRADPVLTHHLRVSEVIVLADAPNVLVQLADEPLGWQQIEAADRIVLTKGEALPDARLAALAGALARINPDALIEAAEQGVALTLPALAGFEPAQLPPRQRQADHADRTCDDAGYGSVGGTGLALGTAACTGRRPRAGQGRGPYCRRPPVDPGGARRGPAAPDLARR